MEAASGAFQWAGFDSNLTFARRLVMQANRGIFQWAGFNSNLAKQKYLMQATRGLFGITGRDANFTYTPASTLGWSQNIFPMTIQQGSFFDLAPHITGNINQIGTITPSTALPSGVAITSTPSWRITATPTATVGATNNLFLTIVPSATSDFAARIAGPGVVWWHDFSNAAEVNNFRWTGGFGGGQDPNAQGVGGDQITWQSSGGANGGGYLRATYNVGNDSGNGNSYWWRPFAALNAAGTGKGTADPGANGTITRQAWPVTSGGETLAAWSRDAVNGSYYGHPTELAARPTKFEGTDFYLQVRCRRSGTPGAAPPTVVYPLVTGKHVWLTVTTGSSSAQEIVTYGQQTGTDVVGVQSRHRMYGGSNGHNPIGGGQANETVTIDNMVINWRFSGGWDTLLYHVTPGTNNGTGANRTRLEVWAQHDLTLFPAESGVYVKIWDTMYSTGYDQGETSTGVPGFNGINSLILGCYHNGSVFTTSTFHYDYDQVIFSKATIAAPTS